MSLVEKTLAKADNKKINKLIETNKIKTPQKGLLDYYFSLDIDDKVILLEGLGKRPIGNMLYILRELKKEKYSNYQVWFVVTEETRPQTEEIFSRENMSFCNIVEANSKQYRKLLCTAKYLLNEVEYTTLWIKKPGQVYLNMWHGTALKRIGIKRSNMDLHKDGATQRDFINADYIVMPCQYMVDIVKDSFAVETVGTGKFALCGYPRSSVLFSKETRTAVRKTVAPNDEYIMAYMPTWRGSESSIDQFSMIKDFLDTMDKSMLPTQKLYVNLHHKLHEMIDLTQYKRIEQFPKEFDNYELLVASDCLVTDYSSVFYDYALTRNKIVLYCPDKSDYEGSRGLYADPETFPFSIYTDLAEAVSDITNQSAPQDYDAFIEKYCPYDDENNAERICRLIFAGDDRDMTFQDFAQGTKPNRVIYADAVRRGSCADLLYDYADKYGYCGTDPGANVYLSFKDNLVSETMDTAYPLLKKMQIFISKRSPLFTARQKSVIKLYEDGQIPFKMYYRNLRSAYELERTRVYGNMSIDEMVLYEIENYHKALAFADSSFLKALVIQGKTLELIRDGNFMLKDAIEYIAENRKIEIYCPPDEIHEAINVLSKSITGRMVALDSIEQLK